MNGSESRGATAAEQPSVIEKSRSTMISTAAASERRTRTLEIALIGNIALCLALVVFICSRPPATVNAYLVDGHRVSEIQTQLTANADDKTWIAGEFVTLFRTEAFPERTRSFLLLGSPVVAIVKGWNDAMATGGFRVSGLSLQQARQVAPDTYDVDWLEARDHDQGTYEMEATVTLAFDPSNPVLPVNPWGAHVTNLFVIKEAKVR